MKFVCMYHKLMMENSYKQSKEGVVIYSIQNTYIHHIIYHNIQIMPQEEKSQNIFEQATGTINSTICGICDQTAEIKKSIKESQVAKAYCSFQSQFKGWYRAFPQKFTNIKFNYISQYDYNVRFNVVNALAVFAALTTYKNVNSYSIMQGSLRAIKNAGIVYLVAGLCIAPQIYNPLMHQ